GGRRLLLSDPQGAGPRIDAGLYGAGRVLSGRDGAAGAVSRVDHGELGDPGPGDVMDGRQVEERVSPPGRVSPLWDRSGAIRLSGLARPVSLGPGRGDGCPAGRVPVADDRATGGVRGS